MLASCTMLIGCLLQGGALCGEEVASLTVAASTFTANGPLPDHGSGGAGLTTRGAAISVSGTRTTNTKPVNVVVRGSTFTRNHAEQGAVHVVQYGTAKGRLEVHDCLFADNQVSSVQVNHKQLLVPQHSKS